MTQMTPPPPPEHATAQAQPQPSGPTSTSKLAIVALICSLLICIPVIAPALGLLLGILAIVLISKSNGRKSGKGLAITASVLSVVVMAVHVGLWLLFVGMMSTLFGSPVKTFVHNLQKDDFAAARQSLTPEASAAISDAELESFQKWLNDNCGTLVDVKWDWLSHAYSMGIETPANARTGMMPGTTTLPSNLPPDFPGMKFVFDSGTYYGVVTVTPDETTSTDPATTLDGAARLGGLAIIKDGKVKRFPSPD